MSCSMALAGSDTGRCQQLNGLRVNGGGGAVLSCLVQEGMLLITCGFPATNDRSTLAEHRARSGAA